MPLCLPLLLVNGGVVTIKETREAREASVVAVLVGMVNSQHHNILMQVQHQSSLSRFTLIHLSTSVRLGSRR